MRRVLRKLLMTIWLLLVAAVLIFWVRSHRHFRDMIGWVSELGTNRVQRSVAVESRPGYVILIGQQVTIEPPDPAWPFLEPPIQTPGMMRSFGQLDESWELVLESRDRDDVPARYGARYRRVEFPLRLSGGLLHAYGNSKLVAQQRTRSLSVSYWLLATLLCLPAIPLAIRHRKIRQRRKQGLCLHCGYDLRASPERCPECGKAVQP
jgi:hypothetical protein